MAVDKGEKLTLNGLSLGEVIVVMRIKPQPLVDGLVVDSLQAKHQLTTFAHGKVSAVLGCDVINKLVFDDVLLKKWVAFVAYQNSHATLLGDGQVEGVVKKESYFAGFQTSAAHKMFECFDFMFYPKITGMVMFSLHKLK